MNANDESELLGEEPMRQAELGLKLTRWLVYFGSGAEWYPVGEFISTDATSAIDRAIDIFGMGAGYRAEEIPWDAAPLPKFNRASSQK
jgi:hypothetical protein